MTEQLQANIEAAMAAVNAALGHDAWTRSLDDNIAAYGFCVPAILFDNKELCNQLLGWMRPLFATHNIRIATAEWRASSNTDDWSGLSQYQVDWYGSRCRFVGLGPHLYMELVKRGGKSKEKIINVPMPTGLPLWHTRYAASGCHDENYKITVAEDEASLATMVRKDEYHDSVLQDAVDAAHRRLEGKRLQVAANFPNMYAENCDWIHLGAKPHVPVPGCESWTEEAEYI